MCSSKELIKFESEPHATEILIPKPEYVAVETYQWNRLKRDIGKLKKSKSFITSCKEVVLGAFLAGLLGFLALTPSSDPNIGFWSVKNIAYTAGVALLLILEIILWQMDKSFGTEKSVLSTEIIEDMENIESKCKFEE